MTESNEDNLNSGDTINPLPDTWAIAPLRLNADGNPVRTFLNTVTLILLDDNLKDLFHYNNFSHSIEYSKDAVWHNIKKGKRIDDNDIIFLKYYLSHNKKFDISIDTIRNAITEISYRKQYHPIKIYLESLKWDGVSRLQKWTIKGCGVEDNIYTRAISAKWLLAAVARVYHPGVKFDYVLVLEGKENIGKSSALRILGEPWFTDSINLIQKEQDIVAKMMGNWIIELAEMRGIKKQEQEFIKSFISCQYDEQRFAFRRDPQKYARQSIFCGTSNNMAYLLDETGNRRFCPLKCTAINLDWLEKNKDKLWAEAFHIVKKGIYPFVINGEKLFLDGDAFTMAQNEQKQRLSTDEVLENSIEKYLMNKNEITMKEIIIDHLGYQLKDLHNKSQVTIVGRILKRLGFEKKERRSLDGSRYKYYRDVIVPLSETQEQEVWTE